MTEQQDPPDSEVSAPSEDGLDVYLIRTPRNWITLFLPRHSLDRCAQHEVDRFGGFIRTLMESRYAVVRWVGRVTQVAHVYYQRLEDRIDPLERMIKGLNSPFPLRVLHAPGFAAATQFRDLLRAQIVKHGAWLTVDAVISAVAIMFFWVLVPIPGPNVFFYYPALRMLSHYRAVTGARRALKDAGVTFETWADLADVEASLRTSVGGKGSDIGPGADIEGLELFLRRMG